jgi:hypothetical protein
MRVDQPPTQRVPAQTICTLATNASKPGSTGLGRASCPGLIAALSLNLLRWTTPIGLPDTTVPAARTLRRRLLTIPGRLAATGRRVTLRMPAGWPWHTPSSSPLWHDCARCHP